MKLNDIKKIYNIINEAFNFADHVKDDERDDIINDIDDYIKADTLKKGIDKRYNKEHGDFNVDVHENTAIIKFCANPLTANKYRHEHGCISLYDLSGNIFNLLNINTIHIINSQLVWCCFNDINNLKINCEKEIEIGYDYNQLNDATFNIKNSEINCDEHIILKANIHSIKNTTISAKSIYICSRINLLNVNLNTNNLWVTVTLEDHQKFFEQIGLLYNNIEDKTDEHILDLSNIDIIKILQLDNYNNKDHISLHVKIELMKSERFFLIKNTNKHLCVNGTYFDKDYKKIIKYKDNWDLYQCIK